MLRPNALNNSVFAKSIKLDRKRCFIFSALLNITKPLHSNTKSNNYNSLQFIITHKKHIFKEILLKVDKIIISVSP